MIGCPTRRTLARRSLLLLTFPIQKIAPTGSSLRRLGLLIRSRVLLQFRSVLHMTCVFVIRIKMENQIGRASCREGEERSGAGVGFKTQKNRQRRQQKN